LLLRLPTARPHDLPLLMLLLLLMLQPRVLGAVELVFVAGTASPAVAQRCRWRPGQLGLELALLAQLLDQTGLLVGVC
jgi:hypothetical protein